MVRNLSARTSRSSWLLYLLAVVVVLLPILCPVHAGYTRTGAVAAPPALTSSSRRPAEMPGSNRLIRSSSGQFVTLDLTGTYLINSVTRKPVFLTGDSAWSLVTQLDNSDVELYLSDRASRGFNIIWCAAADNYYQSNAPKDRYGHAPFDGPDFTNEDPDYWKHVDFVLQRAAAHGITVALDPGFVGLSSPGGYLASYLRSSEPVLTAYGAFLGRRYQHVPNLVWALGGDVDPVTGVVPKLTALAKGILSEDSLHLIVAEGRPQAAAMDTFAGTDWMDLNWLYFHTDNILTEVPGNYTRSPFLPPFLGEGWYENEHGMTALQLREQGYWAVLSGAYLGNIGFGNNPMWFFGGGPDAKLDQPSWKSQLGSPGSLGQMYLGKLFRSREHWKLVPDLNHTVMTAGFDSRGLLSSARESLRSFVDGQPYRLGSASSVAARTADGQTIVAYIPIGNSTTITVDLSKINDPAASANSWWFNPRDGSSSFIGTLAAHGAHDFTPPDSQDWVLVIDSRAAHLPPPGGGDL